MKRPLLFSAAAMLGAGLILSTLGFQCASPNITGGKMYYQQYMNSKDTTKLNLAFEMFQKETMEKAIARKASTVCPWWKRP